MDIEHKDILTMKKPHPCGSHEMLVKRSGREFMVARNKIEKNIRSVNRDERER